MGCNCNKNKKYVLTMPDGSKTQHDSKASAETENRRLGGGGEITTRTLSRF